MYGKIFDSIYDGTLAEDWRALVTFQQFIVLSDPDGVVDMTQNAIARRTGIPIEHIEAGVKFLEQPDPYSRTEGHSGVRIERLDKHRPWGWRIVNHKKYRDLSSRQDKKRYDRQRYERSKFGSKVEKSEKSEIPQNSTDFTHTDTDTDTYIDSGHLTQTTLTSNDRSRFDEFWSSYPRKLKKKYAREIWQRKKLDTHADVILADLNDRPSGDEQWREGFIPHPSTYLNQELWHDEWRSASSEPLTQNANGEWVFQGDLT
jgi:hypothetical protein